MILFIRGFDITPLSPSPLAISLYSCVNLTLPEFARICLPISNIASIQCLINVSAEAGFL